MTPSTASDSSQTPAPARLLIETIASAWGVPGDAIDEPGVTVVGDSDRAGKHIAAGYQLGVHLAIFCDPADVAAITAATSTINPSQAAWEVCAVASGASEIGGATMLALPSTGLLPKLPPPNSDIEIRSATMTDDREMLDELLVALGDKAVDDADIDLDDPDDFITVAFDGHVPLSYAGSRAWAGLDGFSDIGIAVVPGHRQRGIGTATVAALCLDVIAAGVNPLYRRNEDNVGSDRLARSLGFEPATSLTAFTWPSST